MDIYLSKTAKFISKANEIHSHKYDYFQTIFIHSNQKVIITCSKHGNFYQTPKAHLQGANCKKCAIEHRLSLVSKTTTRFIKQAQVKHNKFYSYIKTNYISNCTPVIITCPIHGDFVQVPSSHLCGSGCKKCSYEKDTINKSFTLEEFLQRAVLRHHNFYNYSLTTYKNSRTKIKIICPKHGLFAQRADLHLQGKGCKQCGLIKRHITLNNIFDTTTFLQKSNSVHNYLFDYSKTAYICSNQPVSIICSKHGEFLQLPHLHLKGRGCPNCQVSKGELEIATFLQNMQIIFKSQYRIAKCRDQRALPFDFAIFNTFRQLLGLIEYQGSQHYKEIYNFNNVGNSPLTHLEYVQYHDKIKKEYCNQNNIPFLIIPYWEKKNIKALISAFIPPNISH